MGRTITSLRLLEIVGSPHAVSSSDGDSVRERIVEALRHGDEVIVSFAGIEDVSSAFLNAGIGQLYGEVDEAVLRQHLRVENAERDQVSLLNGVIDRAKEFFRDRERYDAAISGALSE